MRSSQPVRMIEPPAAVYELLGDVARPGIYRYADEQCLRVLARASGADIAADHAAGNIVAAGTRLTFSGPEPSSGHMAAAVLLLYFLPISFASASVEDLMLIPGIGPSTARAMIAYRESAGPLNSLEQLMEIRGIGPATIEKITPSLRP